MSLIAAAAPRAGPVIPPPPGGMTNITITETGLPPAQKITWGVTVSGLTHRTSATTLTFEEPTGSYIIGFLTAAAYEPNQSLVTVTLNGSPVFLEVTYTLAPIGNSDDGSGDAPSSGLFGLPGSEGTLLLLVLLGGGAALAAVLWIRRRRPARRAAVPGDEEEPEDRPPAKKRSGPDSARGRGKDTGGTKRQRRRREG
jgi:uncharacterized iron-regulated membrane protein